MIVRIFRVRVFEGRTEEWQQKVEAHSIPWMREQDGLIAFYPGKPVDGDSREFSITSIWKDVDSIRHAVGEDWQQAVLLADEAEIVHSVEMHHYETFG
ncbi:MAG: antibiotic biosynthesis monooxygenase [Alphaproteobacteria bacterium]|nr:antibiotic biosynthesis monooxygenase [Alphaproteobacteria bacterium]